MQVETVDETKRSEILARLDRIPIWPYGKPVMVIVGVSYFFAFFDILTFGYTLPVMVPQLHSSTDALSVALTTNLVGYIIGAYLIGTMSDLLGRRAAFVLTTAAVSVGSLATAFTMNVIWLDVWRFVTGIGTGAMISLAATYLSEIAPTGVRSRYNGWANVYAIAGQAAVPFIALGLVPTTAWGWRGLYVLGALGGVLAVVALRVLPESPRWLLTRQRGVEAERVVERAEAVARATLRTDLPEPRPAPPDRSGEGFPTLVLLRRPYLGRLVLWVAVYFLVYVSTYRWLGLGPTLLAKQGLSLSQVYSYLLLTSVGSMIGVVGVTVFLVNRFEKKYIIFANCVVWAIGMLVIASHVSGLTVALGAFLIAMGSNANPAVVYMYSAEHFPTQARTTGTALTDGLGHLGGALSSFLVLGAYGLVGFQGAFVFQALLVLAGAALLMPFGMRTLRKPLGEIAG